MSHKCDLCSRKFRYKEVYISATVDGVTHQLHQCLQCASENKDDVAREGIEWGIYTN